MGVPVKNRYLEATFRHGQPIAAYLYLPRDPGEKSCRTTKADPGLIVDWSRSGKPIGIEITAPAQLTVMAINGVLEDLGLQQMKDSDLAPLRGT